MQFSENWLRTMVDPKITSDELSHSLTMSGLEVEEVAPVGKNFRDYYLLNDLKFTIKLTPNKADCLSVLGVAREVSALTGTPLKAPTFQTVTPTIDDKLPVKVSAPDLCGRFSGRII